MENTVLRVPLAETNWTPQEQWIWDRVCAGTEADLNKREGNIWPLPPQLNARRLRPAFLKTILFHESYRRRLSHRGVHIVGVWFQEHLDLSHATLSHPLCLEHSRFDEGVNLRFLRTSHLLSLEGSSVDGCLDMYSLETRDRLIMHKGIFTKVDLRSAAVGGYLSLSESQVKGCLDMYSLKVEAGLFMNQGRFVDVNLNHAHIEDQLDLTNATVTETLDMYSLETRDRLIMHKGIFTKVDLRSAAVGGYLSLSESQVKGCLDMYSLKVEAGLFMNQGRFVDVNLNHAHIEDQIDMTQSTVTGALDMSSIHVGQSLLMDWRTCATEESPRFINASFAQIGANLVLSGKSLPSVGLTGTSIKGALQLAPDDTTRTRGKDIQLTLRNTKVGALQYTYNNENALTAWPDTLELDGFTYDSLGELTAKSTDDMVESQVSWFKIWLQKQHHYTPQPYEHLARVLLQAGYRDQANSILFGSKRREHQKIAPWTSLRWWWLLLHRLFIGYGHYNFRVLWWVLIFWILGTGILYWSGQGQTHKLDSIEDKIAYSLDRFLPIVQLQKSHEDVELQGIVRWYFYVHQVMGYVLASFLIAGLAGLTKK